MFIVFMRIMAWWFCTWSKVIWWYFYAIFVLRLHVPCVYLWIKSFFYDCLSTSHKDAFLFLCCSQCLFVWLELIIFTSLSSIDFFSLFEKALFLDYIWLTIPVSKLILSNMSHWWPAPQRGDPLVTHACRTFRPKISDRYELRKHL